MNKCAVLKYKGHPGLNQGPVDLQSNRSTTELYRPENMVTNNTT